MSTSKIWKTSCLVIPLIFAGYFFGKVCTQVDSAYMFILSPSMAIANQLVWLLLAVAAVLFFGGLVVALVRPLWLEVLAFSLSGLAILFGWQLNLASGVLVLVYVIAGILFGVRVSRGLGQLVCFSIHPIGEGKSILLIGLFVVVCGSFYMGFARHVAQEGFTFPQSILGWYMETMEKQVLSQVPERQREQAAAEFREQFQTMVNGMVESQVKPYERYIPFIVSLSVFMLLETIAPLIAWMPIALLGLAFPLLKILGVAEEITETREVQRLVIS